MNNIEPIHFTSKAILSTQWLFLFNLQKLEIFLYIRLVEREIKIGHKKDKNRYEFCSILLFIKCKQFEPNVPSKHLRMY